VVAIDGAAGSGKSTLARGLARALGLPYVNTGLMYRALTDAALRSGADLDDGAALSELLQVMAFGLSGGDPPELLVDGSPPAADVTSAAVENNVSRVAAHPQVRALMRDAQRHLGEANGAVMEGRDIGAVVFPDAPVKLYLVATASARAERRADERPGDEVEVEASLRSRDAKDAAVNPFRPPEGAITLDTGWLDAAGTVEAALTIVRERAPELIP
jgi:cytidylate kinase